jgi:hypothetical protein
MAQESEAARYRQRAERLRKIAAEDSNRQNRELLERVAQDYDRMAKEAEMPDAHPIAN